MITAREIIQKKRDRETLTPAEITAFIKGYVSGEIADYQVSAWLMAVYLNGLNTEETAEVLGVSAITVKREWQKAKAWLYREINRPEMVERD